MNRRPESSLLPPLRHSNTNDVSELNMGPSFHQHGSDPLPGFDNDDDTIENETIGSPTPSKDEDSRHQHVQFDSPTRRGSASSVASQYDDQFSGANSPMLSPMNSPLREYPSSSMGISQPFDGGCLSPGFEIEFYALDRRGRRLDDPMAPVYEPPVLFRIRDGDILQSAMGSHAKINAETEIEALDMEIESRLLSVGRPLPCMVALYGVTRWGKKPLQVALGDGTLPSATHDHDHDPHTPRAYKPSIANFIDKFLGDDLFSKVGLSESLEAKVSEQKQQSFLDPESRQHSQPASARTSARKVSTGVGAESAPHPTPAAPNINTDPTSEGGPENPSLEESDLMDYISPQLTSLRCEGRTPTLQELVGAGYLEPTVTKKRSQKSLAENLSRHSQTPGGQGGVTSLSMGSPTLHGSSIDRGSSQPAALFDGRVGHRQIIQIDIMYDEMRAGIQQKLPDIEASAPHGESATRFAITDDVPVDIRVDMRNISRLDLDDSNFDADFNLTFSWLLRVPPQIVKECLSHEPRGTENADVEGTGFDFSGDTGKDSQRLASSTRRLWRPKYRFQNRVDDEVGFIVPSLVISERQRLSRGKRLRQDVVDSYWHNGNSTRQEQLRANNVSSEEMKSLEAGLTVNADPAEVAAHLAKASSLIRKRTKGDLVSLMMEPNFGGKAGRAGSLAPASRRASDTGKKAGGHISSAEQYEKLTRRPCGADRVGETQLGASAGGRKPRFQTDEVSGVTELMYTLKCDGLRFSVHLNLDSFPFDMVSLPISLVFSEPFAIYQAHISRSLLKNDEYPPPRAEENSSIDSGAALESSEERSTSTTKPKNGALDNSHVGNSKIHPESIASLIGPESEAAAAVQNEKKNSRGFKFWSLNQSHSESVCDENDDQRTPQQKAMRAKSLKEAFVSLHDSFQAIPEANRHPETFPQSVAWPQFKPTLDLVPIPGRMRLRVSNDMWKRQNLTEHHCRSEKWGIEDTYVQKIKFSKGQPAFDGVINSDEAFMSLNARVESVHELTHRWARPVLKIKVHVRRKTAYVINYVYLPLFFMTFISLTTILVGYGMELVSAFGDRCSITLTLLLTIVAMELPDTLKEVNQVKEVKKWAFEFIVCVILKDILAVCVYWVKLYYLTGDIASYKPWTEWAGVSKELRQDFYGEREYAWWHRIWFLDGMASLLFLAYWVHKLRVFIIMPQWKWTSQKNAAAVARFEGEPGTNLLRHGSWTREYINNVASRFGHDRWTHAYKTSALKENLKAQRHKPPLVARKKNLPAVNTVPTEAASSPTQESSASSASPVFIRRQTSQQVISLLLRTGRAVVPPKWKSVSNYASPDLSLPEMATFPPPSVVDVSRAQHPDEEAFGKPGHTWRNPGTKEVFVNIFQPWRDLRKVDIAVTKNKESTEIVFSSLEARPHSIRTELANDLHMQWQRANGAKLSADDKLRSKFHDLPWEEQAKNMTWVNFAVDSSAIAHHVHYTVDALFNADNDDMVSSDEFLKADALKDLFQNSVRVPVRKGDLVKVRDVANKQDDKSFDAVVISWKTEAYWDPLNPDEDEASIRRKMDIEEDQDDLDQYDFAGTVFLVRLVNPEDRKAVTRARVSPAFSQHVVMYGPEAAEFVAVPETALCWPDMKCSEFEANILSHMDWLFDADGTCVVSDDRLVPMDPLKRSHQQNDAARSAHHGSASNNKSHRFSDSMASWRNMLPFQNSNS